MGTPTNLQNVDERGYVFVTDAADCQIVTRGFALVANTLTPIPQDTQSKASSLPGRRRIYIKNTSATLVHLGGPDVTTMNGYPLAQDEEVIFEITDDLQLYAISTGAPNIRTLELA